MEIGYRFKLPCFENHDGKLLTVETDMIPGFIINRIFYVFDVPKGESRGNHACMNSDAIIVSLAGSFKISIEKKGEKMVYIMDSKYSAVYVPAGSWIIAFDFSEDAIMMTLSDKRYVDCIYIDNYAEYKRGD